MTALAIGLAALVGVCVGVVLTRWIAGRRNPVVPQPDPPSGRSVETVDAAVSGSLREAVDHLEIGVVVVDESGAVRYRNAAATAFRGTHVGVLLENQITDVVRAARSGASHASIVELHGPPKLWLELSGHALPSGGAIVTMRDVGERMRTDAMRTDFVTNISHELKTPVGAVAVLAEALIDETDPVVVHRLSDHLVEEAHRAVRTIDDLLKLSEIESARPIDDIVDLASIVRAAIDRGRVVDGGRGVEITALEVPDGVLLRGDERQLLSAVGNLVENAVKYSHAGGVVQVRTRVDDSAIEVMVADQGVGIPRRDLDRVFERFYRVDKARSRGTGGTGLGLSIVRHVATNHGGEVLVSSQEGEGSTFVLRLPANLLVPAAAGARSGEEQVRRE